ALAHEVVVGVGLLVVGPVRALQALLADPVVAQVDRRGVPRGAGADDDHPALVADEGGGRDRRLPRMLEHDPRAAPLADYLPDPLAELTRRGDPLLLPLDVVPERRDAPVVELVAVDVAGGAEPH